MGLLTVLVASALVCVFVKWLINFVQKCRSLPSGPWGVPLFGYLPWVTSKPYVKFIQLAEKYGSVFNVTLGSETMVVLNDWPSIKSALVDQKEIFSGRPNQVLGRALSKNKSTAFAEGPVWQKQRCILTRSLNSIGMGQKSMESRAMDMVHDVTDTLMKHDGKILEMHSVFFGPVFRVKWSLISSNKTISESSLKELESLVSQVVSAVGSNGFINMLPWLRFVPPIGFGYWKLLQVNKKLLSSLKAVIDLHQANWNEGVPQDVIDFYLAEIKAHEMSTNKAEPPYTVEYLQMSLWGLFMAAVDTTNSTCLWGMLYLAYHPEIQKKAQDELDSVIGRHRLPTLDDISRLPYFQALIMEIHRKASAAPLSVPHKTLSATSVCGVSIPQGVTCLQNIHAVHHDPTLWDQPEIFKPERFITEDGVAKAPPYLMPFSIGPRICVGQSIAELEFKMIFSCLLHQFSFYLPPNEPKPTLEPVERIILQPRPFSLLIERRKT